jgi:DNA damage-binding protein 1
LFRLENDISIKHEDSSSIGFVTNQPTLAVANCCQRSTKNRDQSISMYSDANIVQVTPAGVTILEFDSISGSYLKTGQQWTSDLMGARDSSWKNREIVAASLNPSQILLGMKGSRATLFELDNRDQVQLVA